MKKENLVIICIAFAIAIAFFVSGEIGKNREKYDYREIHSTQDAPHVIYGKVWYNNTKYNATYVSVNIYNVNRGEWWNVTTDAFGWYQANLGGFGGAGWGTGENIIIYAYGNASQCWVNWSGNVSGTVPYTGARYNITLEPDAGFYDVGIETINFPSNNSYIYPINYLINATVKNYGAVLNHTFPVEIYILNETGETVYSNSTTITLQPGQSSYVEFLWKPANMQMNYTIFVSTNMTCPNHDYIPSTDCKNVSVHVIFDTLPPEITNVSANPNPQEVNGYVNITCNVTDAGGVNAVKVNITYPDSSQHNFTMNAGSYYYNATYSILGTYYYFIWANDTSSNSNVSGIYSFTIIDTTPPEITNVSANPNPQEVNGYVNITCNVTDNVAVNVVKVNITYPDSTQHNFTMNAGSYYYNATYSMPGIYNYFIWVNDTSSNSNVSGVYSFTIIDTTPPEISNVSAFPVHQEYGGYVNITCDVTDNVAVNVVKVNITYPDSSQHNFTMNAGYYFNQSYFLLGEYNYFIWANDTSGLVDVSEVYRFSIEDTTPPQITNISANPGIQIPNGYVNITCNVTDNVAVNVVKVNITYPDSTQHNFTMNAGYYFNQSYSMVGTYYYFIWVNDTSSNSNVSAVYEFIIANDSSPPEFLDISISLSVIPEDTDGIPLWGEKTNISANITDENEITSVKINLTPLGFGVVSMNHINGSNTWYIETNASTGSAIYNSSSSSYVVYMLEINATDEYGNYNTTYANITVWKNGDVSGDGEINMFDVTYLAKHYFNQPGFEEMHENVGDVSGDGEINMFDVTYLAKHYFNQPGFEVLK